jgi:hypothetical protein
MKLVMSTSALIGRRPMEVRRRCSHSGEGPFLTRAQDAAQPGHSVVLNGDPHRTGEFALDLLRRLILELAHVGGGRSRAMPCTPVQS